MSDNTNLSLTEMLALPEDQRNTIAIRLCTSFPEPLQLMILCSTEDAYKAVSAEVLRREQEGPKELSIAEILALPEDERNELAKNKGVVCWNPYTVMAIGCAPPNKEEMRYTEMCEPLLDDDDDDENHDGAMGVDGKEMC